jgi:hypothetical protein
MPNETYGLIVRAWTTTESLQVVVVVSYTFTTAPESNITLHPAEVEIEVRNIVSAASFLQLDTPNDQRSLKRVLETELQQTQGQKICVLKYRKEVCSPFLSLTPLCSDIELSV